MNFPGFPHVHAKDEINAPIDMPETRSLFRLSILSSAIPVALSLKSPFYFTVRKVHCIFKGRVFRIGSSGPGIENSFVLRHISTG